MRPHILAVFACLALGLVAACDVASVESDPGPGGAKDATASDAADAAPAPDAGPIACQPLAADTGCPDGMDCNALAKVCTDCILTRSRCDAVTGERETCDAPVVLGPGQVDGGFYRPNPCPTGTACRPAPFDATCEPVICKASTTRCQDGVETICDASGTVETTRKCPSGHACYDNACKPIRHNVLVVFDTSGSMTSYVDGSGTASSCKALGLPCPAPFPVCDDPDDPLMLITLAKRVFADTLQATVGGFAQFALQRFPQQEKTQYWGSCLTGGYQYLVQMTGDDDAKETPPSGWFVDHLGQVLVVPFPPRNTIDNMPQLLSWLDNVETIEPQPDRPCVDGTQCGGNLCQAHEGRKVCWTHGEHELRPTGSTPLGKSLFYASEYFRRFVVVDGRPCTKDLDCASSGYVCDDGICRDPYRHCRDNHIVVFTDGAESEHPLETSFFNPAVQAKRMAFGLGCTTDADCRGGARCNQSGVCLAPPTPCTTSDQCPAGASCQSGQCTGTGHEPGNVPTYVDPDGYQNLSAPDGSPLSIKVSVVTLQDVGAAYISSNVRIARAGGGVHLDVHADDPEAMQAKLLSVMGLKAKCTALP